MEQQAAIYKVDGVDENATSAQNKKKRKQNGDEVCIVLKTYSADANSSVGHTETKEAKGQHGRLRDIYSP